MLKLTLHQLPTDIVQNHSKAARLSLLPVLQQSPMELGIDLVRGMLPAFLTLKHKDLKHCNPSLPSSSAQPSKPPQPRATLCHWCWQETAQETDPESNWPVSNNNFFSNSFLSFPFPTFSNFFSPKMGSKEFQLSLCWFYISNELNRLPFIPFSYGLICWLAMASISME